MKLRQTPEEDKNNIIMTISLDTRLALVDPFKGVQGGWYQVKLPNGQSAWLRETGTRIIPEGQKEERPTAAQIIATARQFLGVPYVWGGTRATQLDCSGFVYRVFHANGVMVARDADPQARAGKGLIMAQIKPGDLVFFNEGNSQEVTHVGIAIGENHFIDANYGWGQVVESDLSSALFRRIYWGASRYLDQ